MEDPTLTGSLEDNVLTCLCWDAVNGPVLATRLTAELFSTRAYRRIADVAIQHIQEFGQPPRAHLPDLLEREVRKGEDGSLILATLGAMKDLAAELQPAYVLKALDRFVRLRRMSIAVEQASDMLVRGDAEEAQEALLKGTLTPGGDPNAIWLHDTEKSLSFMDEDDGDSTGTNYFGSGVPLLDEKGVRPRRKEMFLVLASAKKGKSWWLLAMGKEAMIHGKNVLHVSLENSAEVTTKRYYQGFFGLTRAEETLRIGSFVRDSMGRHTGAIDFDNVVPENLAALGRAGLAKKAQVFKRRGKLVIKEYPTKSLTMGQLNAYLDSLEAQHRFVPDLLVLDYADLMHMPGKDVRIETGQLYQQLRGLAVKRNLALATASQGNRGSSKARVVGSDSVAEDWSKIGTADTVVTYSQTPQEKELRLARLLVANARNVPDGYLTLISQSYANGQFCLDSAYMSKHLEQEMKRLGGEDTPDEED